MFRSAVLSLAALVGLAAADCYYCTQQGPFKLQIESANATLNGQQFASCHSGAAIETLCVGYQGSDYYYNTTATPPTGDYPQQGLITWNLTYNTNQTESEPLTLQYSPFSNVAVPVLEPTEYNDAYFSFTSDGYLAIAQSIDDTVVPAAYVSPPKLVQNWYVCQTYYGGYRYTTLAWVVGVDAPQNPSCQKVSVKRA